MLMKDDLMMDQIQDRPMTTQQDNNSDLSGSNSEQDKKSRRRFIKGSSAVPILMAVQSRSVWAAGCSVSGQLSGNLSNTANNDCDGEITGRSPGYWEKWINIYNKIKKYPTYNQLVDAGKQRAFTRTGEGAAINVLYNWSLAANLASTWIDIHPTDSNGNISYYGDAISNTSDQALRHLTAALLSAAHPDSQFPYPSSMWSVQYILDMYLPPGTENSDTLIDLIISFYDGSHIDAPMLILNESAEGAYNWAKAYLNL